jgi:uncharacterized protein Yka (UPF0111/DUF47 family)
MKNTENLVNDGKAQWSRVKSEVEQLGVQLALGRSEAKEAFEREWKKFSGFLDEQSHRLRRHSYWADHLLDELEQRAKTLKTALKQAGPENEKVYNSWRENILRTVYELEFIIDELYPVLEEDEKELLSTFRIKMEVYRTRLITLSLGELASLHTQAPQLADKADDILIWRDRDSESSREKVQRFGKEVGTAFEHMKQAFGELFK